MNFTLKGCTDLNSPMPCLQSVAVLFKRLIFREGEMNGFVLQLTFFCTRPYIVNLEVNNVYKPNCTYLGKDYSPCVCIYFFLSCVVGNMQVHSSSAKLANGSFPLSS